MRLRLPKVLESLTIHLTIMLKHSQRLSFSVFSFITSLTEFNIPPSNNILEFSSKEANKVNEQQRNNFERYQFFTVPIHNFCKTGNSFI